MTIKLKRDDEAQKLIWFHEFRIKDLERLTLDQRCTLVQLVSDLDNWFDTGQWDHAKPPAQYIKHLLLDYS